MLGLPAEDMALLTSDPAAARIHVSFMGKDLLPEALLEKMATGDWLRIVAFRPTGGAPAHPAAENPFLKVHGIMSKVDLLPFHVIIMESPKCAMRLPLRKGEGVEMGLGGLGRGPAGVVGSELCIPSLSYSLVL